MSLLSIRRVKPVLIAVLLCAIGLFPPNAAAAELTPDVSRRLAGLAPGGEDALGAVALPGQSQDGPLTVLSEVTFAEGWNETLSAPEGGGIWLVRLAGEADETALGIEWAVTTTGWFPTWQINLRHAEGDELNAAALVRAMLPRRGRTYQAALSYDPESGWTAVRIVDTASGQLLYAGAVQVSPGLPYQKVLAGGAEVKPGGSETGVRVSRLDVYDFFIPVDLNFDVVSSARADRISVRSFERRDAPLAVRLRAAPVPVEGEYLVRARHHDSGEVRETGPVRTAGDQGELAFPFADLTDVTGRTSVAVEYVSSGHTWLSLARDISVGWVSVELTKVAVDAEGGRVNAEVTLRSDGPVTGLPLRLVASFRRTWPEPGAPRLRLNVAEYTGVEVFDGPVDLEGDVTTLAFEVPLPGEGSSGLWEMAFSAQIDSTIETRPRPMTHIFGIK